MFNSMILGVSREIQGRMNISTCPIVKAFKNFYLDMFDLELDGWRGLGGTDEDFIECFEAVFPTGFLRRDLQRAKNIIFDLHDIAESDVPRLYLSPINTYVIYHLMRNWYELLGDLNDGIECPKEVINYLKEQKVSDELSEMIISWFTDFDDYEDDFGDVYNYDYVSVDFAEQVAFMYLNDEPEKLQWLGVTMDEFLDILPNDLREQCLEKQRDYAQIYAPIAKRDESNEPIVFISYSWDSEAHKEWIKKFSEQLHNSGINVILDQNDLVLGDPLSMFMEQSIANSDYVLIMCTPNYKKKADSRKGGVGYEESIITSDVLLNQNHRKYITVLTSGTWEKSAPIWAKGKYGVDLTQKDNYNDEFHKLVHTIKGK